MPFEICIEIYNFTIVENPENFAEPKPEPLPDNQHLNIDLDLGKVQPKNDYERKLLREIREMEANGIMIDLPLIKHSVQYIMNYITL